jgi:hypothetical protein
MANYDIPVAARAGVERNGTLWSTRLADMKQTTLPCPAPLTAHQVRGFHHLKGRGTQWRMYPLDTPWTGHERSRDASPRPRDARAP